MLRWPSWVTAIMEEAVDALVLPVPLWNVTPVAATNVGIHDYDHLLPNDSPDGFEERLTWLRDFGRRLMRVSPDSG